LLYEEENPYERAHFTSRLYPSGTTLDGVRHTDGEVYLETRFYKPEQVTIRKWDNTQALPEGPVLYVTKSGEAPGVAGLDFRLVYSYLPDWLWRFNVTGWMDRTLIWKAYEVTALTPR